MKITTNIKALLLAGLVSWPLHSQALDIDQYPVLQQLVSVMSAEDNFPPDELRRILSAATIDEKTLQLMDKQWESLPWHKYRKIFINQNRIDMGVKFWTTYQLILERAEKELGVPAEVVVAVIGVETHYGTRIGDKSVLDSLVTLSAAYPRRSKFFTSELRTFLNMTRGENIDPESVVGSFAGAIGIPQFMPSSYEAYSVDFNGNGQRDLVNETDDAIGSVANYLSVHGWESGQKIYAQVDGALPAGASSLVSHKAKLIHDRDGLASAGVNFDQSGSSARVSLVSLSEENGPRYIVGFRNLDAITRYNPSVNYAMAVAELSEAIELKFRSP